MEVYSIMVVTPRYYTVGFMLAPSGNPIAAFYQHAHFISIVGVGKERRTLIGPW